jgi:hypothetical protein
VLHILAGYSDRRDLFENYPDLEEEDLKQARSRPPANGSRAVAAGLTPIRIGGRQPERRPIRRERA